MNPLNPEEVKAKIITELEIAHLPEGEQEQIIATLAEALLERATTIIMAKMPEAELANVDALAEVGNGEVLQEKIMQFVPDAPQIIDKVVTDGIAEYKQLVEEEKGTAPEAAPDSTSSSQAAEPIVEENFVVNESGEAQPSSPLINPSAPSQPAY